MKTIFKYASLMVAALGFASCVEEVFPLDQNGTEPQTAPGIEITISEVKDSSFTVKIAPADTASYYSFLVDADTCVVDQLDADDLYAVKYTSVAQGTVKYAAKKDTTFTINADPFTFYTVYAVVGSPEGNVGAIAHKTFQTSDEVAPFFLTDEDSCYVFETDGAKVYLKLSEEVVVDTNIVATANIWPGAYDVFETEDFGMRARLKYLAGEPAIADQPAVSVTVANGIAEFDFGEMPSGSVFTVNIPEGQFQDYAGNKTAALESAIASPFYFLEKELDCFDYVINDVAGWIPGDTLHFTIPEPRKYGVKTETFPVVLANALDTIITEKWNTVITRTNGNVVTTITNKIVDSVNIELKDSSIIILPAGDIEVDDEVVINIPAGTIMDNWGNVNIDPIKIGPMVYSELTIDNNELQFALFNKTDADDTIHIGFYAPGDWTIDTAGLAPFVLIDTVAGGEGQHEVAVACSGINQRNIERTVKVASFGKEKEVTITKYQSLWNFYDYTYVYYESDVVDSTFHMVGFNLNGGELGGEMVEVEKDIKIVEHPTTDGIYYVEGLFEGVEPLCIFSELQDGMGFMAIPLYNSVWLQYDGENGFIDSDAENGKSYGQALYFLMDAEGNLFLSSSNVARYTGLANMVGGEYGDILWNLHQVEEEQPAPTSVNRFRNKSVQFYSPSFEVPLTRTPIETGIRRK